MANQENHGRADPKRKASKARPLGMIYNGLSVAGCVVAAFGIGAVAFLFLLPVVKPTPVAYAVFTFAPAVAVILLGLLLIGAGLWREKWRESRGRATRILGHWALEIDLNRFKQSRVAALFLFGVAALTFGVFTFGAAALRGLQFAESNAFCGTVCHSVMHPEASVYEASPHARIKCAECHIGHGRGTFLRSKLNGLRQLSLFVKGNVRRPIPTPIHDQRPSRLMCENCHWPERWIDYKTLSRPYFRSDAENTARHIRMEVKVGGGTGKAFRGSGIHYHMEIAQEIEYIARDEQRQDIPWVRVSRVDGSVTEFKNKENPLSDSEKERLKIHTMSCLDCHNRPAHRFSAPTDAVNRALANGKISTDIPYIKREGVRVLDGNYASTQEALYRITHNLRTFYQENHRELVGSKRLEEAVEVLRAIYQSTIFPEMKADWSAHPDNIGHRDSPGCFRCHNYEMVSEEGDTIFKDCSTCHVIVAQIEPEGARMELEEGRPFLHPFDDAYLEVQIPCWECHNGGFRPYELFGSG